MTSVELAGSGAQEEESLAQLQHKRDTHIIVCHSVYWLYILGCPHLFLLAVSMFHYTKLNSLFDVVADEPLHQRSRLSSGNTHHRLASG